MGLSCEIKKDSFNCNINALLSFKSIEKLSKPALWPSNKIWSKIADVLGILTNLLVKGVILKMLRSSIFDHMLLDGHKSRFDNFSILLKERNAFKLQLKESLLISRDKPILTKNIYSFPLELLDWLWHCYLIFIIFVIPCQYIIII